MLNLPRPPTQERIPPSTLGPLILDIASEIRPDQIITVLVDVELAQQEPNGPGGVLDVEDAQHGVVSAGAAVRVGVHAAQGVEVVELLRGHLAHVAFGAVWYISVILIIEKGCSE